MGMNEKNILYLKSNTCDDAHSNDKKENERERMSLFIANERANKYLENEVDGKLFDMKRAFCYLYACLASLIIFMCKDALNASHAQRDMFYVFIILVLFCYAVHRIFAAYVSNASLLNAMSNMIGSVENEKVEFEKNMIGNYGKRMSFKNLHAIMSLGGRMMCR